MIAMFKVTFRRHGTPNSAFTTETVLAKDAADAVAKATRKAKTMIRSEGEVFATDVTLLGVEI